MRVKLITLRFSSSLGGFDERPLDEFLCDKDVLSVRDHFFMVQEVPHIACLLTYQPAPETHPTTASREPGRDAHENGARTAPERTRRPARRGAPDPTEDLSEPERLLFGTLREWRLTKARSEGVPPFVVFTNRQLVDIVRARPESRNGLLHIEGIGPGKIERYGAELLERLGAPDDDVPPHDDTPPRPRRSKADDPKGNKASKPPGHKTASETPAEDTAA